MSDMFPFKSGLIKLSAFIIALQILNMSIESPNAVDDHHSTSTDNYNYIDTYVEYFTEVIFKYENAIPEQGKRHQNLWQQHKFQQVICENIRSIHSVAISYKQLRNIYFLSYCKYAYRFIKEISQPPEFSC